MGKIEISNATLYFGAKAAEACDMTVLNAESQLFFVDYKKVKNTGKKR